METIIFNSFLSHFSAINAIVFSDSKKISKKEYNIIYSFVEEYSEKQRELSDLFIQESKNPELNKLRSLIHNFCELYPIQKKCLNDRILTLQRELLERCHFEAEPNEALKEADEKLKIEQQKMRMFHNTIDDFNKAKVKYSEESKKHSEAHNEVFMAMQNCCTTIADKLHEICKFTNEILEPDSSFNEFISFWSSVSILLLILFSLAFFLMPFLSFIFIYFINFITVSFTSEVFGLDRILLSE